MDRPISELDSTTPQQVILSLIGLTDDIKEEKVFIIVEKDYNRNYQLFYKKKFHCDASTMVEHLAAVMSKQYNKTILHIFDLYY